MIDAAGPELMEGRQPDDRQQQRDQRGLAPGDAPRDRGRARHRRQQPQHRPDGAHQPLGDRGLGEQAEEPERAGEPGIDQPRPVRLVAAGDARAACRSYQPCPASQSRSCASRIASSVSCSVCAVSAQCCARSWITTSSQASAEQEREVRLAHRCGHDAPVSRRTALSFA